MTVSNQRPQDSPKPFLTSLFLQKEQPGSHGSQSFYLLDEAQHTHRVVPELLTLTQGEESAARMHLLTFSLSLALTCSRLSPPLGWFTIPPMWLGSPVWCAFRCSEPYSGLRQALISLG